MPGLSSRPCLLVANKADGEIAARRLAELRSEVAHRCQRGELENVLETASPAASRVLPISTLRRRNLDKLAVRMGEGLAQCRRMQAEADEKAAIDANKAAEEAQTRFTEPKRQIRHAWPRSRRCASRSRNADEDDEFGWVRERDSTNI